MTKFSVPSAAVLAERIHDRAKGEGPSVVMLPGLGVSRYLWPTQDLLASMDLRVHLLDLPGTGLAADAPEYLGVADDSAAVTYWLRTRLRGPVVLVGHSYGSLLAARVAAAAPATVKGIVLGGPTPDPAYASFAGLVYRWLIDSAREPRSLGTFQRPEQRRAGIRRMLSILRSIPDEDVRWWLGKTAAPVTVVRGSRDALSTPEWCRLLADRPGGRFREIPAAAHAFPYRHPAGFAAAIRETAAGINI